MPGPRYDAHGCAPTGAFGPLTNALIAPPLDLETLSIDEIQRRLRAGTLTSTQLVKAYLDRIGFVNRQGPGLNVVRAINPAAMTEAAAADAARGSGPLAGVPVLVDDTVNVKGMATTGGALALENLVATDDATVVTKLRAAGAIILGKANVTELKGMVSTGMPTGYGSLSGQAMNPYDMRSTSTGVERRLGRRRRRGPGRGRDRQRHDHRRPAHRGLGDRRRRDAPDATGSSAARACCRRRSARTRPARPAARSPTWRAR